MSFFSHFTTLTHHFSLLRMSLANCRRMLKIDFTSRYCTFIYLSCVHSAFSHCLLDSVTTVTTTTTTIHLATYYILLLLLASARTLVYVCTQMANGFETQIYVFLCNLEKTSLRKMVNFCISRKAQTALWMDRRHNQQQQQQIEKEKQLYKCTLQCTFECIFFLVIQHVCVVLAGAIDMCLRCVYFSVREVHTNSRHRHDWDTNKFKCSKVGS